MSDHQEAKQATPHETLLAELLDSRVPKSEREHAAKREIERLTAERDELRRQFDPMGEYASADELIAALHAEKAEDEAMKLDARRYRWLRGREDGRYMTVYAFRTDVDEVCLGEELDATIDAARGASNE